MGNHANRGQGMSGTTQRQATTCFKDILGEESVARFRQAGRFRHGLPPPAYTDERVFDLECASLFARHWFFAGFAHEIATAGDVTPVTVGRAPVLLVRNRSGEIKAFHNVCRHRCLQLVEEAGNVGPLLRCPYHAWAYDLDGALRAAPSFDGTRTAKPDGLDRAERGLVPVSCAVWHDWIFVKLDGDAGDFDDTVAPLARQLQDVDFAAATPIASLDFGEVNANWKLLMENFIEPYHVPFVHKTTTDQPLDNHYTIVDGNCLGSAVDVNDGEGGRKRGGGSDRLDVSSRYLTLFPNFVLGRYFPDQLGVHLNSPLGAARTRQRRIIYWVGDNLPPDEDRAALSDLWFKVHKEDHAMVERLQKGRASVAARDGGVLSPHWETSVRRFQELVFEALD